MYVTGKAKTQNFALMTEPFLKQRPLVLVKYYFRLWEFFIQFFPIFFIGGKPPLCDMLQEK